MEIVKTCHACGKEFFVPRWRAKAKYCSVSCQHEGRKATPNAKCPICGASFHAKPFHVKKYKIVCCSMECSKEHRRQLMTGDGNHQHGLKGDLNASFKGKERLRANNRLTECMVYVGEWYKYATKGRVPKHRFVIEKNYANFSREFLRK